jgi:predicted peroxiredoxin
MAKALVYLMHGPAHQTRAALAFVVAKSAKGTPQEPPNKFRRSST